MTDETVKAVIPARYSSERFPGKPLADILDRPMIEWVIEGVASSEKIDQILVATDDSRIYKAVEKTQATPLMTSDDIDSGSDRVAEAMKDRPADLVVNVQGDEPLISGQILDEGIEAMKQSPDVPMGSFMAPAEESILDDPDIPKVVVDRQNRALYFSRAGIPFNRSDGYTPYQHVGIYFFRREFLLKYANMEPTSLEEMEKLEQLRALENGHDILMVEIDEPTVGVDRPEDVETVERLLQENSGPTSRR